MKFIIPNYCSEDTFVDNVASTLRLMGHEVITPPKPVVLINQKIGHFLQSVYDIYAPNRFTPQENWLLKEYKNFKPDVVLALTQALNEELLFNLKKSGIITVAWWGDTAANMRKQGLLCNGWDYIYIKDKYASEKLKTLGLNAFFLPEAMNPQWHKKNFITIDSDILFAGNTYDYRHYLIRKLCDSGFKREIKLFGNKPPRWASKEVRSLYLNKYIVKEEKSFYFGSSFACINSTAMSEGDSVNCRAFEIAGSAGFQIMEYRSAIEYCFEPEKEIVTFSTFQDLVDKIHRYKNDKKAALAVRELGYKRAQAEHTYQLRLQNIIGRF